MPVFVAALARLTETHMRSATYVLPDNFLVSHSMNEDDDFIHENVAAKKTDARAFCFIPWALVAMSLNM
jgi:hypothetical protein